MSHSRTVDFLHLHDNLERRTRNLETGVHPTGTGVNYYDTYDPTQIIPASGWTTVGAFSQTMYWQRRVGLVTLFGTTMLDFGRTWAGMAAEETIGTLPTVARPRTELLFNIALEAAPFFTQLRVQTDGKLRVLKPPSAPSDRYPAIRLEGPNWTAD